MSANTPTKKRQFKRKQAKKYSLVEFEVDFIEGTFSLPSFKQVPVGVQRKSMTGDMDAMMTFIENHATDGTAVVEALDDMDEEEIGTFLETWATASDVNLGK